MVFLTLEDETGIINLIVRPAVFERYQRTIISSASIRAYGVLERSSEVLYLNVSSIESLDGNLRALNTLPLLSEKEVSYKVKSYSY